MDATPKIDAEAPGRFDQSFFLRMIVSFLAFLLVVALIEAGLRFSFELYAFRNRDLADTQVAAERLAADIRTIMLNEGGPVASRTVYPILERNYDLAGLAVAVEPSEVTRSSIRSVFGFEPRGIPRNWRAGAHQEVAVDIRAEQFCLKCHGDAAIGDVLGTVRVRKYLDTRLDRWWGEVRLSLTLNLLKIVIDIVILFFLLRTLMAPLLSLRAAVSRLSHGSGGLSARAEVRSADEFGELAYHLNLFLDRVQGIVGEVRTTIRKTLTVSTRLTQAARRGRTRVDHLAETLRPALSIEAEPDIAQIVDEVHEIRHVLQEIEFLDERLNEVTETGSRLMDRLADVPEGDASG